MPSTFTSNTGIELIADGEQAGAWGQTTNDNFDIVDRALNGSVSIALSGTTHTLTTADGVLSDGQFAVLVFTGSPSDTNTVTIAPNTAQKTYFVTNSTAQTVVLSQGSGANVGVPAGLSKIVFTNGGGATAAVFDITNTLSGNLTGNLTGNASTATALQTARTIGGVSFNGTSNINLPGVNQAGDQNTSGNAATAAALQTARTLTIGSTGKTFNGTANVSWNLSEIGAFPAASIPSGTKMLFAQTTAPTGWTKDTTHNNKALRVVSGTAGSGGSVAFTTAFSSKSVSGTVGNTTLSIAQMPNHDHNLRTSTDIVFSGTNTSQVKTARPLELFFNSNAVGDRGGGNAHNHSFTGTAINLAVQFVDVIIATKD